MPAGFPCPNPTCAHVFPPEAIQGATSLKCPRCGSTFNFRAKAAPRPTLPTAKAVPHAKAAAARPPQRPAAPVAPPVAVAMPVTPAVPLAAPVAANPGAAAPNSALVFTSTPDLTIAPTPLLGKRRAGSPWRLLVVLAVSAVLAGGLLTALFLAVGKPGSAAPADDSKKFENFNFSLRLPEAPWQSDESLRDAIRARMAFSRKDPVNHLAIEVIDYKMRAPRQGVLLDEALERLRNYFGADVPWQPRAPATLEKFEPQDKLAGQPARVLEFEGNRDNVAQVGECYLTQYRGRAYLLFTFAPQGQEAAREEWAALRGRFGLLNERPGWTPQPPPSAPFQGDGYALAFVAEVWKKMDLGEADKNVVLALEGHDPKEDREGEVSHAGKAALLRVAVLEPSLPPGDVKAAAAAARKNLIDQQLAVLTKTDNLELVPVQGRKGEKLEGPANVGAVSGYVSKNRMRVPDGSLDRFVVVAAVPLAERLVVVYAECDWKRRDYWEQEFNALLDTFKKAP